jgi:hypothetical protein
VNKPSVFAILIAQQRQQQDVSRYTIMHQGTHCGQQMSSFCRTALGLSASCGGPPASESHRKHAFSCEKTAFPWASKSSLDKQVHGSSYSKLLKALLRGDLLVAPNLSPPNVATSLSVLVSKKTPHSDNSSCTSA